MAFLFAILISINLLQPIMMDRSERHRDETNDFFPPDIVPHPRPIEGPPKDPNEPIYGQTSDIG